MLFLSLQPFIETGVVNFIPDPCIFDPHLQHQSFEMASDRRDTAQVHKEEIDFLMRLAKRLRS